MEYRGKQYSVILTIGGKWKWSATLTLDQARAQNSLSPINAEVRAVMNKV